MGRCFGYTALYLSWCKREFIYLRFTFLLSLLSVLFFSLPLPMPLFQSRIRKKISQPLCIPNSSRNDSNCTSLSPPQSPFDSVPKHSSLPSEFSLPYRTPSPVDKTMLLQKPRTVIAPSPPSSISSNFPSPVYPSSYKLSSGNEIMHDSTGSLHPRSRLETLLDRCDLPRNGVVLRAKYSFIACGPLELDLKSSEHVRLVEKVGYGWLKVQKLGRSNCMGLVPSSYVEISINDSKTPVSLEWLHDTSLLSQSSASVLQGSPILALVVLALCDPSREFWYKILVTYSLGQSAYYAATYQMFYKWHVQLHKTFPNIQLPRFPSALVNQSNAARTRCKSLYLLLVEERRVQLNSYVKEVFCISDFADSDCVAEFLKTSPMVFSCGKKSDSDVNEQLVPGSVEMSNLLEPFDFEYSVRDSVACENETSLISLGSLIESYMSISDKDGQGLGK